jgi:proton glutamate symport protein
MLRSLTARVLVALIAGVLAGLAISATDAPMAHRAVDVIEPVGTLFINAIRMTVIPLVVSSLIVGVASANARAIGRLGRRALGVAVAFLCASALAGALIGPPLFSRVSLDPAAAAALRARAAEGVTSGSVAESARRVPTFAQWLVELVPVNPIRAAADGAMLPLIVFAIGFGLALLSLTDERRAPVIAFFRGVADAMLRLVQWVLAFAPLGVFALALPLVARLGVSAVGALASYVVLIVVTTILFVVLVVYPAVALAGGVSMTQFARAVLPAQAVAFSSRSSLVALPALIEGAQRRLGMSEETSGFLLPLAAALFRVGASMGLTIGALFVARLYGIDLSPTQIATIAATAVLTSFSIPGIPGGSIIAMLPVLASVGLPAEGIGVLLGVDTIPDAFRTTANVTGQMGIAVIAGRGAEAGLEERTVAAGGPPHSYDVLDSSTARDRSAADPTLPPPDPRSTAHRSG